MQIYSQFCTLNIPLNFVCAIATARIRHYHLHSPQMGKKRAVKMRLVCFSFNLFIVRNADVYSEYGEKYKRTAKAKKLMKESEKIMAG